MVNDSLPFLIQAAYNVGGHVVSADLIQNTILGCRTSRPGQVNNLFPMNSFVLSQRANVM